MYRFRSICRSISRWIWSADQIHLHIDLQIELIYRSDRSVDQIDLQIDSICRLIWSADWFNLQIDSICRLIWSTDWSDLQINLMYRFRSICRSISRSICRSDPSADWSRDWSPDWSKCVHLIDLQINLQMDLISRWIWSSDWIDLQINPICRSIQSADQSACGFDLHIRSIWRLICRSI